jgi:hypothetical protein
VKGTLNFGIFTFSSILHHILMYEELHGEPHGQALRHFQEYPASEGSYDAGWGTGYVRLRTAAMSIMRMATLRFDISEMKDRPQINSLDINSKINLMAKSNWTRNHRLHYNNSFPQCLMPINRVFLLTSPSN